MASVSSVSKAGTTTQPIAAAQTASAAMFRSALAGFGVYSPPQQQPAATAATQRPNDTRPTAAAATDAASPASTATTLPLLSGPVAAQLSQQQEIRFATTASGGAGRQAARAYGQAAARAQTTQASDFSDIFTPGMPSPTASGRLLDLLA